MISNSFFKYKKFMVIKKERDKSNRFFFHKLEIVTRILRSQHHNNNLPLQKQKQAYILLRFIPKKGRISYIRNRCVSSYRSRSIVTYFKISHITFRKAFKNGDLYFVKKASW